jgi:hypothetical protein
VKTVVWEVSGSVTETAMAAVAMRTTRTGTIMKRMHFVIWLVHLL